MRDQETLPGMRRTGEDLMIEGTKQVLENEPELWKDRVQEIILSTARRHRFFTADSVKREAKRMDLGEPHHPNAWGAAFRVALLAGVMERTGRYVRSERTSRHSSMIPQYRSLYVIQVPSDE